MFSPTLLLFASTVVSATQVLPSLNQHQSQLLRDRLFQTNLRGPRWTGNDNQNTLTALVSESMQIAGLSVDVLNYNLHRWDPRWWSLSLNLVNGTTIGLPTTGYWPYSGNSGLAGITFPIHDAGSYGLSADQSGSNPATLNLNNLPAGGSILFLDNPSPTRNYSSPGYSLLGTSRNISSAAIPELGNLTNPHWQSAKTLDFPTLKQMGVAGVIAAWVNTSDDDAALQFLPNVGAPGDGSVLYEVPSLYVGESTGHVIRDLVERGQVKTATLVLDAPSYEAPSSTVIGHLKGKGNTNSSILIYTHSDGPSIIEENGPILLLSMAEHFAKNLPNINIDFVITTGHMSGGHLDESRWMTERPALLTNAKAAIVAEHFGALEMKDVFTKGGPVYTATGKLEPMWTMANDSSASDHLHNLYLDSFIGTSDSIRMALLAPQTVNGVLSKWYGAGGSSTLGKSRIPTIGIIPQPDYLWAAMPDGGWSKLDVDTAIEQINIILRLITSLDASFVAGKL